MLNPSFTNQFQKDVKGMKKRNKDMQKLKLIMSKLINEENLEERYRDHKLSGEYKGRRDCHIEPDWVLIYKKTDSEIIFERTGSHSDLFR